jgi:hypothetical protein
VGLGEDGGDVDCVDGVSDECRSRLRGSSRATSCASRAGPAAVCGDQAGDGGVGVAVDLDVDVDEGDLVAATVALAGCDQFAAAVGFADVQDFDFFADDRDRAWEAAVLVKRCLSGSELFVFVVAVDGDVLDQAVELGCGG